MTRRLRRVAHSVFIDAPVEMYIFWLSYFAFGWGLILFIHTSRYTNFSTYRVFREFGFEPYIWLLIYTGISLFGFYACLNGARQVVRVASMLMFILWLFTTVALFIPNMTVNTGTFVYTTFSLVGGYIYVRVSNNSFQGLWS